MKFSQVHVHTKLLLTQLIAKEPLKLRIPSPSHPSSLRQVVYLILRYFIIRHEYWFHIAISNNSKKCNQKCFTSYFDKSFVIIYQSIIRSNCCTKNVIDQWGLFGCLSSNIIHIYRYNSNCYRQFICDCRAVAVYRVKLLL